jgi:beta-lactamase superfamily II metal-dependent hydrolase
MVSGIEIDFLPVGEGEHSGDAIAVRWVEDGNYKVLVYDGGHRGTGQTLVDHVKKHYNTTHVHFAVNSHPDNDHAGGLSVVLEQLSVGQLWMHQPWNYSDDIRHYFHDGRITSDSLAKRLQDKMSAAYALEKLAEKKEIPVYEPFAGSVIGIFTVLSPEKDRYVHDLIPEFEKSPELRAVKQMVKSAASFVMEAMGFVAELWTGENLPDTVSTSAENESSAVLFAAVGERGFLLTGDAGVDTLRASAAYAASRGVHLPTRVTFAQIPHHGGRHNVSTETLNLVFGEPHANAQVAQNRTAFVSASQRAPRHPKRKVTNAFNRRGFVVTQTKGASIRHSFDMPARPGWVATSSVPFYEEVEE